MTQIPPAEPVETEQVQPVPLWPWLQYIDIADQLKTGITVILMYHHDCPTCAQMVPLYDKYAREMAQQGEQGLTIAFVAVPPYGDNGPVPDDTPCLKGRLSDKEKWAIMSPYVVVLIDGGFVKDWPQGTAPDPQSILDEIFQQP
jgi:thiol-disulfide isomerase/thioredoxin